MRPERVYLYGPPGSGKTSVGRDLANALDLPFLDLDELIETEAGRSIVEIFAVEGEDGFRARERDAIDAMTLLARHGTTGLRGLFHATESAGKGRRVRLRYLFRSED